MSREWTTEEIRDKFLKQVEHIVKYWDELPGKTTTERLEGSAFTIMSLLDGCSMGSPGFIVAPMAHEDDEEYLKTLGENYYPYNDQENIKGDIGGGLHELIFKNRSDN